MKIKDAIKDVASDHVDDVIPFLMRAIPVIVKWWKGRRNRKNLDATMDALQRALNDRFDEAEQSIRDKHARQDP